MLTYNNLIVEFLSNDISNIDKPLIPVNIGDCFKFQGKSCEITHLYNNGFKYKYHNSQFMNPQVNGYYISYYYWNKNIIPISKGLKLKYIL